MRLARTKGPRLGLSSRRPQRSSAMSAPRRLGLAPLVLASLLLALCGLVRAAAPADAPQKLRVQLIWYHQAEFAGLYVAEALGYYEAKGLDVELIEGGTGKSPLGALANGEADVAMSWLPDAI